MKTSENLTVLRCFQGVKKGCIEKEWVKENFRKHILRNKQKKFIATVEGFNWLYGTRNKNSHEL